MSKQWDSFYLLPTTIPIQQPPKDGRKCHTIDEWWDSLALEPFLNWIFSKTYYDVFIVNYPYLSKALEFAPSKTLKILDMHDKFTGRRELLESLGCKPDFFYTTEDQEKIALDRADIIFAIKGEEANFFKSITNKPVITMPHVEPFIPVENKKEQENNEYLVVGIVGAVNKININNFMKFMEEGYPIIKRSLAPVKILIAGGMSEELKRIYNKTVPANIEFFGRFKEPEDFYSKIDLIMLPISVSTGLKIKAIEALSYGLPIVSLKHAIEGIPTYHPYHQCNDMRELAEAIVELAYNPNLLNHLKKATYKTYDALNKSVEEAYEQTIERIVSSDLNIVICLNSDFFSEDNSMYRFNCYDWIYFLINLGKVFIFFDNIHNTEFYFWAEKFYKLPTDIKLILSPRVEKIIKEKSINFQLPFSYQFSTLSDFAKRNRKSVLFLFDLPEEILKENFDFSIFKKVYMRVDLLRSINKAFNNIMYNLLKSNKEIIAVGNLLPGFEPITLEVQNIIYHPVPFWKNCNLWSLWPKARTDTIWLAGVKDYKDILRAFWDAFQWTSSKLKIILPTEDDCNEILRNKDFYKLYKTDILSLEEIYTDISKINPPPAMVIEICDSPWIYAIIKETLIRRCGTIWENIFSFTESDRRTLDEILDKVFNLDFWYNNFKDKELSAFSNDAGYFKLWSELTQLKIWG